MKKLPNLLDDSTVFQKLQNLDTKYQGEQLVLPKFELDQLSVVTHDRYQEYLNELSKRTDDYRVTFNQVEATGESIKLLIEKFSIISLKAQDFKESTHNLAINCETLTKTHDTVSKYLSYFENLDPVVRKLNHSSSANIVKKDSFKTMLMKIDTSLAFIEKHPNFKESESYRIRFKQCMIRSCSLMGNYLSLFLKNLHANITEKLESTSHSNSSSSAQEALLYNKFASNAPEYFSVSKEISIRAVKKSNQRYRDELLAILHDCYNDYFQIRMKLLHSIIWQQLDESIINEKNIPLMRFIQDNLLFFTQLCTNEYNLLTKFFPEEEGRSEFNEWLFRLCEPLHDCVRSRVLRESDISSLCDAVTLLNKYYQFEENSQEYELQFKHVQFDKIFEPILQDVQSRLVFRAQIYVETTIVRFKPSRDAFMISHRKLNSIPEVQQDPIVESFISNYSNLDGSHAQISVYYPPLIRAIALLSKIYQMVNSSVFDDLAHHIVHDCIISLRSAYNLVEKSEKGLDTKLSYLRNLLLLRSQIENFDIQFISNETYLDFSGLGEFLRSLKDRKFSGAHTSVLSLAKETVPKVVNDMVDARSELMVELRNVIKSFTEASSREIVGDCFEKNDDLLSQNIKLRENVERLLPRIYEQMLDFIDDMGIINHLLDAIQELVVQSYADYYERIEEMEGNSNSDMSKLSELMCVDVFSDLLNNAAGKLEKSKASM